MSEEWVDDECFDESDTNQWYNSTVDDSLGDDFSCQVNGKQKGLVAAHHSGMDTHTHTEEGTLTLIYEQLESTETEIRLFHTK